MSHANGQVRFQDGTVLHCEYDGTCDFMRPVLFATYEEMLRYWRTEQPARIPPKPVEIEDANAATDYGDGFSWPVKASKSRQVIVEGLAPFQDDTQITSGLPEWWEQP